MRIFTSIRIAVSKRMQSARYASKAGTDVRLYAN